MHKQDEFVPLTQVLWKPETFRVYVKLISILFLITTGEL